MLSLKSNKLPLVLQNPLSAYVTSLPYIDAELTEQKRNQVNKLVQEEMKSFEQKDYLGKFYLSKNPFPFPKLKHSILNKTNNIRIIIIKLNQIYQNINLTLKLNIKIQIQ